MDRRVQIIRQAALFTVAIAVHFLSPLNSGSLFVFFMAGMGLFPGCNPCCGGDSCGSSSKACSGSSRPASITAAISGFAGTCTGAVACSGLDGTYICSYTTDGTSSCEFVYTLPSSICTYDNILGLISFGGVHTTLAVGARVGASVPTSWTNLTTLAASPIDCSAIGTKTCTLDNNSGSCSGTGTSATFTV